MNSVANKKKTMKIAMSERRPISIDPDEWPTIASAEDHDGKVYVQANNIWYIAVIEHADMRRIVYGYHESGQGGQHIGFRPTYGGFLVVPSEPLVPNESETVRAIRRVAGMIARDDLGSECIGDLPAEAI